MIKRRSVGKNCKNQLFTLLLLSTVVPGSYSVELQSAENSSLPASSQFMSNTAKPVITDLETRNRQLSLNRYRSPSFEFAPGSLGKGWRTNFDYYLAKTPSHYLVLTPEGSAHRFKIEHGSIINQQRRSHLYIDKKGTSVQFVEESGRSVTFHGSLPVKIELADQKPVHLYYTNGLLSSAFATPEAALIFVYNQSRSLQVINLAGDSVTYTKDGNGKLTKISKRKNEKNNRKFLPQDLTKARKAKINNTPECEASVQDEQDELCNSEADLGEGFTFNDSISIPNSAQIDLRPSNCGSFFDQYAGMERGFKIESGFSSFQPYLKDLKTVRNFPVIDFLAQGEARIMISRDLLSATYRQEGAPNGLYDKLIQDANAIDRKLIQPLKENGFVSATENGKTTTLQSDDFNQLVLELVVQHGVANINQIAQIERARIDLLKQYGIVLRVIEIP